MFAKIAGLIVSTSSGPRINLGGDPMRAQIAPSPLSAPPPVDHFKNTVNKYSDYIENPPPDITLEGTQKILDWAKHQKQRLSTALAGIDMETESERHSDIEEKQTDINCLIDAAKESIRSQNELFKFERELSGLK